MKKLKQQTIEKEIPVFGELHKIKAIPLGLNVKIPVMLMLFIAALSFGQLTKSENYIDRKECLNGDCSQYSEAVTYFDGLGRAKQVIGVKDSPAGKDVVTQIEYDQFGRPVKDYLSVPQNATQSGGIYTAPLSGAVSVYGAEKIYSEKVLENSPLGRIQKQFQRGNDWSSKPVTFGYAINTLADKVRRFITATSWENDATKSVLGENELYPASLLYKNTVTDEDGNTVIEFKNSKGQVVLSRKVSGGTEDADTYYIYNEYDQLAFVIPPLAGAAVDIVSNPVKQEQLLYQYRYDKKNRLVEKKMPGKGWEYSVYNKADQLILTQDTVLKGNGQWLFTKYDQFGKTIYTGITNNDASRVSMQNNANVNTNLYETRASTAGLTLNGMPVYYTNLSTPTNVTQILSVNYYDTYPPGAPSVPTQVFGYGVLQQPGSGNTSVLSTKGLVLAYYIRNIDDDRWTKNYTYYDTKGREVSTVSFNYQGGYTKTETELDFTGNPLKTYTYHKRKFDETGVTLKERFVYDAQNRLKQHYHQVDDMPEELLSDNTYNELSQLVNKKIGNNLQSIDYTYNIRGWLTGINKDQMSVTDLGGKLFSYKVKYTQKEGITNPDGVLFPGKNVAARYNGNIAEVDWRSVEIPGVYPSLTPKRYGYAYDSLNRLTAGFYQNPLNPYSKENTESMQYDLNGNITGMYRTSVMENGSTIATKIDDLAYTYNGNIAVKIKDNSGNSTGYEGTAGYAIGYDANGNITSMPDKRFSEIKYNILNLPALLSVNLGTMGTDISSLYRADGTKLNKTSVNIVYGYYTTTTTTEKTDYLDGFQYYKKDISTSGGDIGTELMMMSRAMEPQAFTPILVDPTIDPVLGGGTIGNITLATPKTPDLQFFPTSEGFYDYQKNQYIYQYKDLYGNVRVSFGKNSEGALEIIDNNDYYPYGMNHLKTGTSYFGQNSFKKYKFLGNELQETGIYDMNARFYMPDVGRFLQHDPLSNTSFDPYGYSFGNPVFFKDPAGLIGMSIGFGDQRSMGMFDWYRDSMGNVSCHDTQADQITGTNGEALTRLGVSGSYINVNGSTTTLNRDASVTQGGVTSYMVQPSQMSSASYNDSPNISAPGETAVLSSFDTSKTTPQRLSSPALWDPSAAIFNAYLDYQSGRAAFRGLGNILFYESTPATLLTGSGGALEGLGVQTRISLGTTRVGHWSPLSSYKKMISSGSTVTEQGGMTFFATDGTNGWTAAPKGWVYSEMDIPTASLINGGQANWLKAVHSEAGASQRLMLQKQGGMLTPPVFNISQPLLTK